MKDILEKLENKKFQELKIQLEDMNIADIASIFEQLEDKQQIIVLFKLLSKDNAADVFSFLAPEYQETIINALQDKEIESIMEEMYMDDATDFVKEMPANVVKRVLKNTTKENRDTINKLLTYPENSAGSIMTTEFIDIKQELTVDEAFLKIKQKAEDAETIGTMYVTDAKRKIQGVVSIKDLIIADRTQLISDIMNTNVICACTNTDQEEVSKMFDKYDFYALPVIDAEQRLVGIITIDDVMDVVKEETTEDMEIMAAVTPMEDSYLKTKPVVHFKKRILWLLILTLSASVTGAIISHFEALFVTVPALVSFIPMLMDTGGNCGSQASVLIIRSLALGEVTPKDYFKIVLKEACIASMCGAVLSIVNFFVAWWRTGSALVGLVIALTLIIVVFTAKIIGGSLPILAKKCKLDPAVMASPMITTLVDCISIISYFLIASAILGL